MALNYVAIMVWFHLEGAIQLGRGLGWARALLRGGL